MLGRVEQEQPREPSRDEEPRPDAPREAPKVVIHTGGLRCPYCHDEVPPEKSVACRDCLARHHLACWGEGGRCSACQSTHKLVSVSGGAFAKPAPPPRAPRTEYGAAPLLWIQSALVAGATLISLAQPLAGAATTLAILVIAAATSGLKGLSTPIGEVVYLEIIFLMVGVALSLGACFIPELLIGFGIVVALVSFALGFLSR
jgi:hypothetical protein